MQKADSLRDFSKGSLAVLFAKGELLLRSYICLKTSVIALGIFMANKIPLRPKGVISLSLSENITLCVSTEYNLFSLFCCKRVWVSPKSIVRTNAMLVLSL